MRTQQPTPEAIAKRQQWNAHVVTCNNCGEQVTKNTLSIHKRRYWCKTSHLLERPNFEEWLTEQDYDTLLWEYKETLKEILNITKVDETQSTE